MTTGFDLDQQTTDAAAASSKRQPIEATIATTPADVTDDLFVTIDGNDGEARYGPVLGWVARPALLATDPPVLPVRGDNALVVRSDGGSYWMVAWQPA